MTDPKDINRRNADAWAEWQPRLDSMTARYPGAVQRAVDRQSHKPTKWQDTIETALFEAEAIMNEDPDISRGIKVLNAAKTGHTAAHGNNSEKAKRWAEQRAAYNSARKKGESKKAAKLIAAAQCGVSVRTIERALKKTI